MSFSLKANCYGFAIGCRKLYFRKRLGNTASVLRWTEISIRNKVQHTLALLLMNSR